MWCVVECGVWLNVCYVCVCVCVCVVGVCCVYVWLNVVVVECG